MKRGIIVVQYDRHINDFEHPPRSVINDVISVFSARTETILRLFARFRDIERLVWGL